MAFALMKAALLEFFDFKADSKKPSFASREELIQAVESNARDIRFGNKTMFYSYSETEHQRVLTVLNTYRYIVDRKTGLLSQVCHRMPDEIAKRKTSVTDPVWAYPTTQWSNESVMDPLFDRPGVVLHLWNTRVHEFTNRLLEEALFWRLKLDQAKVFELWRDDDYTGRKLMARAHARLKHMLWGNIPLRGLVQALQFKLQGMLDPEGLRLTHKVFGFGTNLAHYNLVQGNLPLFQQLEREAPNLLPLVGFMRTNRLIEDSDMTCSVLGHCKQLLKAEGLSEAGWRWLAAAPKSLVALVVDRRQSQLDLACTLVNRLATGGSHPRLTVMRFLLRNYYWMRSPFSRTVAVDEESTARSLLIEKRDRLVTHITRELVKEASTRKRNIKLFVFNELAMVIDWLESMDRDEFSALPKNISWKGLMARQVEWHQRSAIRMNGGASHWTSLVPQREFGKWLAVPLVTGLDLYTEGTLMHHCVASYTPKCAQGSSRVFSLRAPSSPTKPVATLELGYSQSKDAWSVFQVRGPCNSQVNPSCEAAAKQVCAAYNKSWAALSQADKVTAKEGVYIPDTAPQPLNQLDQDDLEIPF